jgi:hypothetical protein
MSGLPWGACREPGNITGLARLSLQVIISGTGVADVLHHLEGHLFPLASSQPVQQW